ncbi:hypothetical protein [Brevibacillus reuszeri]|uniref:hypothetical protein n=1 Tax=Brevibacillus reuszeri TaxID=54915 RepID=UPI003D1C6873
MSSYTINILLNNETLNQGKKLVIYQQSPTLSPQTLAWVVASPLERNIITWNLEYSVFVPTEHNVPLNNASTFDAGALVNGNIVTCSSVLESSLPESMESSNKLVILLESEHNLGDQENALEIYLDHEIKEHTIRYDPENRVFKIEN